MIHICYITGLYNRHDPLIFCRQGYSMAQKGHKVSIVVCDNGPNEKSGNLHIYSTHYKPQGRISRFVNTKRVLMKLADELNADVYQITDPEHITLVDHFRKRGKVVIFNMREFYPDMLLYKHYIPYLFRNLSSWFYKQLMKHYLPKYGAVFTVTPEFVDKLICDYGLKNVHLLTNFPIPNQDYYLSKEEYLSRPNMIIYEGTIYKGSRQDIFLDALMKIPDVHYLLVGIIDENNEAIQQHPAWDDKVEFVNGFKVEQLPGFFARSTISNTLREFGEHDGSLGVIKIFESMEAALPVIFSDVPLYRKIVEKWHCGVCANPSDVNSVSAAIRYLVDNKEEAYEMGKNGRRAVLEEYNWMNQAKKYEQTILKLLDDKYIKH